MGRHVRERPRDLEKDGRRKRKRGRGSEREKHIEEREGNRNKPSQTWKNPKAEAGPFWGEGHVLLNEDFHQVDVATGGRSVQRCPQLIVLGIHVGTVGKEQLDDFLKVVDAALQGGPRLGQLWAGPQTLGGHAKFPSRGQGEGQGNQPA